MNPLRADNGGFEVDAAYLAAQFRLDPADVPGLLKSRRLQALCERGEGDDAGRYRLSFRLGPSRLSLIVDEDGNILRRMTVRWPRNGG